ncbi:hypothetical protein ACP4OV_031359 [Aristida adscensionis]
MLPSTRLVPHSTPLLGQCPWPPLLLASPPCRRRRRRLPPDSFDASCVSCPPSYGLRRGGWMRIGAAPALAAATQAGDLDPRHHHRVPHGGDGAGAGGGRGAGGDQQQQQQQQQEADEQHQQQHHRLLQLHHQVQEQEPPSVPVFQLQHLQAAPSVRQRGLSAEYALLAPMGDAGQSHHHGFQPQLLSFGGVGHHHLHQFTAQPQAPAAGASSHARSRGGGEVVAAAAASASHSRVRGGGGGGGGGEIVAVQGGHIVRSTGRKDRHSKVCTARGPRDRRVRLSAHTAIQFYDVQDRLGYDRPSKAVDWLIKNAKDAIDKLDVLPAWHPTAAAANAAAPPSSSTHPDSADNSDDQAQAITVAHTAFDFPGSGGATGGGGTGFLPASLDSDSIADTIKSFFPMGGTAGGEASSSTAAAHSSAMGFQSYTPDLLSRTGSHSQELRLSLQSLPDPIFHHHQQQQQQQQQQQERSHGHGGNGSAQQALFPGAASYAFGGGAMWAEQAQSQQRMVPWNVPDPGGGGGGGGGYLLNVSQQAAHMQAALGGQSQFLFQRGPLQSSNQPSDRGWPEAVEADNPMHHHHHHHHQHQGGLTASTVFAPGIGFSGFRMPARIQGDEEHNGGSGNGDKPPPPPSVSSASHH